MSFQIENGVLTKYTEENSVTEVTIPDGVTKIGDKAFGHCTGLKSIEIPEGVEKIEDETFLGCISLENVSLPEGLKAIGDDVFRNCYHLNIEMSNSVKSIGNRAFDGCPKEFAVDRAETQER